MSALVFETPGLIDPRSFTLMGANMKPHTTSPIGRFGTGLKYAMAVAVRLGAEPVVWIGRDKYTFSKRATNFRGKMFDRLRMRRECFSLLRASHIDLPYTTEYGRDWQWWMVFRELEANTRDEGGRTYVSAAEIAGTDAVTRIVVEHPEMIVAYEKRDEIFLPEATPNATETVQIVDRGAHHLYYRGLRVAEVHRPTLMTYNFKSYLDLTEDRTLKYEFLARQALGNYVVTCNDEDLIERVVTCDDKFWEHGLEPDPAVAPSRAFHNVMMRHPKRVGGQYHGYYARYDERPAALTRSLWDVHPLPWRLVGDAIVDKNDVAVLDTPYRYSGRWSLVAEKILEMVNAQTPGDPA